MRSILLLILLSAAIALARETAKQQAGPDQLKLSIKFEAASERRGDGFVVTLSNNSGKDLTVKITQGRFHGAIKVERPQGKPIELCQHDYWEMRMTSLWDEPNAYLKPNGSIQWWVPLAELETLYGNPMLIADLRGRSVFAELRHLKPISDKITIGVGQDAAANMAPPHDGISLTNLPDCNYSQYDRYKVDRYIDAAMRLQQLGRVPASANLLDSALDQHQELNVAILCRMLFTKKAGGEFRRPSLGEAGFLGETKYEDWPLEPIELVDGIPFLIVQGYSFEGVRGDGREYIRYCIANCDWSTFQFKTKTGAEKRDAVTKLLSSKKWRRTPVVRGAGGNDHNSLTAYEQEFLSRQIE